MKKRNLCLFLMLLLFLPISGVSQESGREKSELKALIGKTRDLISKGDYERATKYCKKALSISPDFYQIYNLLGYIYIEKEEDKRHAISYFLKSLSISDAQPGIYSQVGMLYKQIGDIDSAKINFEKGLKYAPRDFSLNYQMGLICLTVEDDPLKASEYFLRAQRSDPEKVKVMFITGLSFILADKEAEVLEYITMLRERKEELYAKRLEDALRERQEKLDAEEEKRQKIEEMQKQRELYMQNPDFSKVNSPINAGNNKPSVSFGAPTTQTKASGEITVRRTYKAKGTATVETQ